MSADLEATRPGGVIHDRGYYRYDGQRLGRIQIVRALVWHSFRSAFGIGRGARAKIVPVITAVAMCLPAVVNAISVAKGGGSIVNYGTYTFPLRVIVMTIFVAVQAPELVSRDLRSHVLPLYFSRPLRHGDYPLAKYVAFALACIAMIEVPLLLLYLGSIGSSNGGSNPVWAQTQELLGGLAVGLVLALLIAAISLALASLSGRRAYATGAVAIFFFLTWTLAMIISQITGQTAGAPVPGNPPGSARLAGLVSPFTVVDGIRQWLGGHHPAIGPIPAPGGYGVAYLVVLLVLLGASFAILATRYRKADLV